MIIFLYLKIQHRQGNSTSHVLQITLSVVHRGHQDGHYTDGF